MRAAHTRNTHILALSVFILLMRSSSYTRCHAQALTLIVTVIIIIIIIIIIAVIFITYDTCAPVIFLYYTSFDFAALCTERLHLIINHIEFMTFVFVDYILLSNNLMYNLFNYYFKEYIHMSHMYTMYSC